jgi:hypothetical protein
VPLFSSPNSRLDDNDGGYDDDDDSKTVIEEKGEMGGNGEGKNAAYAIYKDEEMHAHMNVFGRGVHSCLGKTIALMEMKHAAEALAQRLSAVRLADAQQMVEDMRLVDRFVMVPKGKQCQLIFS